ncbi:MAG: hypothetical protein NTX50_31510, partial [Candidatus Sumerlaeota bacterium]|nr:hypothetical protein [Candidatus Sumerlaeota bacterium]
MAITSQNELYFSSFRDFTYPRCHINVEIAKKNGDFQPISGYVDTGASQTLLTPKAAKSIQMDFAQLPELPEAVDLRSCTKHRLFCRYSMV